MNKETEHWLIFQSHQLAATSTFLIIGWKEELTFSGRVTSFGKIADICSIGSSYKQKLCLCFVSSEGNQLSSRAQCKKLIFGAQTCASDFHSRGNESTQHWKSSSLSHFRLALDCWVLKWKESFIIDTATFVHFCVTIWWASTKYSIDLYMWASISNFPRRDRLNILGWLASWDLRT